MAASQSIVIIAEDSVMNALRSQRGVHALADGDQVLHVPLEFDSRDSFKQGKISELERQIAAAHGHSAPPLVFVWRSKVQGDVAHLIEILAALAGRLRESMQVDRRKLPLAAIVIIADHDFNETDKLAIENLVGATRADGITGANPEQCRVKSDSDGSSEQGSQKKFQLAHHIAAAQEVFPPHSPVYLLAGRSRVDVHGKSWNAAESWPLAVSRLIASIASFPGRTPGLRAWRFTGLTLEPEDLREIELLALSLVRQAMTPASTEDHVVGVVSNRSADTTDYSWEYREQFQSNSVSAADCPRHALDVWRKGPDEHPTPPDFWEATPLAGDSSAIESGSLFQHAQKRLNQSVPACEWNARKFFRGRIFIADRFDATFQMLAGMVGPRRLITRVWSKLHSAPKYLAWYARGSFAQCDGRVLGDRALLKQISVWNELRDLDRTALESRDRAHAQAVEIDIARSHFVGLPWRFASIVGSALWAATALGVATSALGMMLALKTALYAGVSAVLAGLLILLLEYRAGRRACEAFDRKCADADLDAHIAFQRRVTLGADGELMQRATAWMQSAARVRESAGRLLHVQEECFDQSLKMRAAGLGGSADSEYSQSVTVNVSGGSAIASVIREFNGARDSEAARISAEFQSWWREQLREFDPSGVGGIPAAAFRSRLMRQLQLMRKSVRDRIIHRFECVAAQKWADQAFEELRKTFGFSSDLGTLSVRTEAATGNRLRRLTFVASYSKTILDMLERLALESHGTSAAVLTSKCESPDWCSEGYILQEVSIRMEMLGEKVVFKEGLPD